MTEGHSPPWVTITKCPEPRRGGLKTTQKKQREAQSIIEFFNEILNRNTEAGGTPALPAGIALSWLSRSAVQSKAPAARHLSG
jgi:hypothetical protein